MSSGNRFVIQELLPLAAAYVGGEPARFEWDAAHHNMPLRPLPLGAVELRSKKTRYPGTAVPSEQVFGASAKDLPVKGEWSDKWNFVGYAEQTRDAFAAMVGRGNQVRIEYRSYNVTGLVVDFDPEVFDDHRIGYSFRVSLHERQDHVVRRAPLGGAYRALDPRGRALTAKDEIAAMLGVKQADIASLPVGANAIAPVSLQSGSLHAEFLDMVKQLDQSVDAVLSTVETSEFGLGLAGDVASSLLTIAAGFALVRGRCQQTIDILAGIRSDTQDAMSGLAWSNFELWRLGALSQAYRVMDVAYEGEREAVTQAKPDIMRIHEAKRGETLMGLALRYYGAADAWTAIAERNGIDDFTLQGGELLIIPVGGR